MFGGISMLFAAIWIREAPIRDALDGAALRKREVDPRLLEVVMHPFFMPTVILTCEAPALLAAWYLHRVGHTESALITGVVAFGLGWLNARRLTQSLRAKR
jgi:hypothetical protein